MQHLNKLFLFHKALSNRPSYCLEDFVSFLFGHTKKYSNSGALNFFVLKMLPLIKFVFIAAIVGVI